MRSELFNDEIKRTRNFGDTLLRYAGRTAGRFALVEAYWDSERYSDAKDKPFVTKEGMALGAAASALLFPLTTGLAQSRVADIPLLGGIAETAGLGVDLAALGGFHIALPLIGVVPWFAVYRPLAAAVTEIIPDRKVNAGVRHPRFFQDRR